MNYEMIESNDLSSLPSEISQMTNLQTLNLSECECTSMHIGYFGRAVQCLYETIPPIPVSHHNHIHTIAFSILNHQILIK